MNYHNKKFRPSSNSENGETSSETVFHYRQYGSMLMADYQGGEIIKGRLSGTVNEIGEISMRYHQINKAGELMTGICSSTPEVLPNGKIRLHETWQWTSGDYSKGESVIEEV